jgi:pimeloyl-ACP methyl ester carboxylesterase
VLLLHGWPYDIYSYAEVTPLLAAAGYRVIVPYLRGYGTTHFLADDTVRNGQQAALPPQAELAWWYQYYFATERGRAGYDHYRREFNQLIWRLASPQWAFDEATFERTAAAFANPDHVDIVIHNYRWRLGLPEGEVQHDELEQRLAQGPVITVPTMILEGDANGAPHPERDAYRAKFTGRYGHRVITGGVGHNLPQEAPQAFAQAIVDVAHP